MPLGAFSFVKVKHLCKEWNTFPGSGIIVKCLLYRKSYYVQRITAFLLIYFGILNILLIFYEIILIIRQLIYYCYH